MKKFAFAIFATIALTCFGCNTEDDSLLNDGGNNDPAECLHGTYEGTAQVTLNYFDPFGAFLGQNQFQFQARVAVDPPATLKTAPLTEDNPFNLSIFSLNTTSEGAFSFFSGMGFTDPLDGEEVLLQYWDFSWNKSSGSINGNLTDTHAAQALALNTLNIQDLFTSFVLPNTMKLQSSITGNIDCELVSLRIAGETTNEIVEFEIFVEAEK